jgi:hypothetical protein
MKTYQEFITEVTKRTIEINKKTRENRNKVNPDYIESEKGEFERYSDSKKLMKKAKQSSIRNLSPKETENLQNTDAGEIKPGAQGRRNARRIAKNYGRNIDRVIKQIKSKTDEPSIVKKNPNGTHELIGGNTRAMVRRSLGKPVRAIEIK